MLNVTDETFQSEVLESELPVLVDFWAPWCGPCKMVGPLLEQMEPEFEGKAKIVKVNVDETEIGVEYGVRGIPTMMVFKGGKVAASITGARPKAALSGFLTENI